MSIRQKGFSPILIIITVVLFVILLEGGYLVYQYLPKPLFTGISTKKEASVVATDTKKAEIPSDWQTFNFKYGQMKISYAPGWLVKYVMQLTSSYQYVDFIPAKTGSVITSDYIITLNVSVPQKPYTSYESSASAQYYYYAPQNNFNIPGLGEGMNAYFDQQSNYTSVKFLRNGVQYSLGADIARALQQKMDPAEITSIVTKMAKSIEFTKETGTCDDPVLAPLTTFPDNFVLSNYHDSDRTDMPTGYWPNVTTGANYDYQNGLDQKTKGDSRRFFLISYEKNGQSFEDSAAFQKSAVLITGGYYYSMDTDATTLMYVNCIDKIPTGKAPQFFSIGSDSKDPFQIAIYGASNNPQNLWGVTKWNTDLLKKTRGEVYIKMGNQWQKYSAKDFYTAI